MIPKTIHYCWFGNNKISEPAMKCVDTWHRFMPDYEYKLWNEEVFDVNSTVYTKEAYEAGKYAFVSDYVRLWALEQEGGIYLDTDVEVFKPFDDLLGNKAFAGFEGSKHLPVGTCVLATEPHGDWVVEMLDAYHDRRFYKTDGSFDFMTNVQFISAKMSENGFHQNGKEQFYKDLHVYPVDYFSPRQTTGDFIRTENTYCDHHGFGSWANPDSKLKTMIMWLIGAKNTHRLVKLKQKKFC